jgi:hypothetical protein
MKPKLVLQNDPHINKHTVAKYRLDLTPAQRVLVEKAWKKHGGPGATALVIEPKVFQTRLNVAFITPQLFDALNAVIKLGA